MKKLFMLFCLVMVLAFAIPAMATDPIIYLDAAEDDTLQPIYGHALTVEEGDRVVLAVSFVGADWYNELCDWWHFAVKVGPGTTTWFSWDGTGDEQSDWDNIGIWMYQQDYVPAYWEDILISLDTTDLDVGTFVVYFGIDDNPNNTLDGNQVFDSVVITVLPEGYGIP